MVNVQETYLETETKYTTETYYETESYVERVAYTDYETVIREVPREKTYTEEVPKTVMKTVTKEVPTTEEKIVYVDEPYEELETSGVSWTVRWYTIDREGNYIDYLGRETFSSTFNKDWGVGTLYLEYDDYVGFMASTKIKLVERKTVTFRIGSDDSSRLQLDGNEIIDNGGYHIFGKKSITIDLTPGEHDLLYLYREYYGDAAATFESTEMTMIWEEMVSKSRSVPTTIAAQTTTTVTEEVPVTEFETVTKTRTVIDKVEEKVPVTKYRDETNTRQVPKTRQVPYQDQITKTRTIQVTLLEYLLNYA